MSEDPDTEMYNEGAGVTLVSVGKRKHRHTEVGIGQKITGMPAGSSQVISL